MWYIIKSGELSDPENGEVLAQIKTSFQGVKKTISLPGCNQQYQTDIDLSETKNSGDVCFRSYRLKDSSGEVLLNAQPGYAREDDPKIAGWPINRLPKVDHAHLSMMGIPYLLVMHSDQSYSLQNSDGADILQIKHRGISGGWTLSTAEKFSPQVLCALFIFCRYIERENEFIIV